MSREEGKASKSSPLRGPLGCGCLALVIVLAVIGLGIWYVSKNVTKDPAKAKGVANEFLEFDLPEGYRMEYAAELLSMKMARFARSSEAKGDKSMICNLVWLPGGKKEEAETKVFRIRGEDVEAKQTTVVDEKTGVKSVQYEFFIPGKEGTVWVQVQGEEDKFDEDGLEDFLDSVK
ncbi:MAG: hypothetical protein ACYS47_00600 [Planctomycetota bacterium]